MFNGDVSNPSLDPLHVIGDMPVVHLAIGIGKVSGHGGHDDPVF
jgi:hypothetical protein